MKKNLGLIYGGRSGEHEVSLQSAKSIVSAVDRDKFNLYLLAIDKKGDWFLTDENNYLLNEDNPSTISLNVTRNQAIALVPRNNSNSILSLIDGSELGSLDVVFPIVHGNFGEDGGLQGFCDILNLPIIGPDVLGSSVAMDKYVAKQLLIHSGIKVADFLLVESDTSIEDIAIKSERKFTYPVFVKPACSGSSVGVYKAENMNDLKASIKKALKFDTRVLIEEAIIGREIECAVMGNIDLFSSVPGEVIPKQSFYSYEAKYIDDKGAQLELPAKLDANQVEQVQNLAKATFKALSCTGMARVDMFLTPENELILNEINTLPGFTKISMFPKLMELSGVNYPDLISRLAEFAIERHQQRDSYLKNILEGGI